MQLKDVKMNMLGKAKSVKVTKESTVIVDGGGSRPQGEKCGGVCSRWGRHGLLKCIWDREIYQKDIEEELNIRSAKEYCQPAIQWR